MSQDAEYVAIRRLPVNTRLQATLWTFRRGETPAAFWSAPKPEDLSGKYLNREIGQDKPITPSDLSESPKLAFSKDRVPLTFNLGDLGPLGPYVNAGAEVYVCDQETLSCTGGPYKVETLVGKVESQLVLICLTSKDADEVRKIKKPALRISKFP